MVSFLNRNDGYLVFRDGNINKTIYYKKVNSEKICDIEYCLKHIENNLNYSFNSFTIDDRKGVIQLLKRLYPNTPIQLCQFHQKQIITRYITNNPKTDCAIELKELIKTLSYKETTEIEFNNKFKQLKDKYKEFLKEKTEITIISKVDNKVNSRIDNKVNSRIDNKVNNKVIDNVVNLDNCNDCSINNIGINNNNNDNVSNSSNNYNDNNDSNSNNLTITKQYSKEYKHKRLRSAFRSLDTNLPYLFTYKREEYKECDKKGEYDNKGEGECDNEREKGEYDKKGKCDEKGEYDKKGYKEYDNKVEYKYKIPNTTNACEGKFSRIKTKLRIHTGLREKRRNSMFEKLVE